MAEILSKTQCPNCAKDGGDLSEDNLVTYSDGGTWCFKCGKGKQKYSSGLDLIGGNAPEAIRSRGLAKETCEKYRIRTLKFTGYINKDFPQVVDELCYLFPYSKNGKVVAQKIRSVVIKKAMGRRGDKNCLKLFGQERFSPDKRWPIIVCEGEFDAAAAWQMNGVPSVSITNGSSSARKQIVDNLEWLSQWKEVLLCFDMDEAGRQAVEECLGEFEPGTVRDIKLPLKDANEMLIEQRVEEFKKCVWNAEKIKPSTIVFPRDIEEEILKKPEFGSPWPWASMTKATYGMRKGELYLLAGPTSCGKTEFLREIVNQRLDDGLKSGVFSLEQRPEQTMQRYIGSAMNQRIHIPGCVGWDEEIIKKHNAKFKDSVALYNPKSGLVHIEALITNIRWLYKAESIDFFVIDNLKALATNPMLDGKRVTMHDYASYCMGRFFTLVKELGILIFVVNHLSEDKIAKQAYVSTSPKNADEYLSRTSDDMQKFINRPGMEWESGRVATLGNIFAGGNVKDLTDYIIVLARNRVSEDDTEHRKLIVKFLKTRLDSSFEGYTFDLFYDYQTGRLKEFLS